MEAGVLDARGTLAPKSARLLGALGDERLVQLTRRGNAAAFEAIYNRHNAALLSFCRHMLGSRDEAEDALQHTFISAHRDLSTGEREIRLKPWLFTIARNRCLSILRARREQATEQIEIATVGLSDSVQERADLRELLGDLAQLPDDQRTALVLSELDDLSHTEIADVLGCEGQKVKALVYQARTALTERREAREIPCREIREQLATARGGALRRGPLRKHVAACSGCKEFRDEVRRQRAAMALLLPVVPSVGLKGSVMAAAGIGGGTAGGIGAGGGLIAALGLKVGAAKVATVAALVGGAAAVGGTVVAVEHESGVPTKPIATEAVETTAAHTSQAAFTPVQETASGSAVAGREALGEDVTGDPSTKEPGVAAAVPTQGVAAKPAKLTALRRAAARRQARAKHPGAAGRRGAARRQAARRKGAARRNASQRVRRGAAKRVKRIRRQTRIRRQAAKPQVVTPKAPVKAPKSSGTPSTGSSGASSGKSSSDAGSSSHLSSSGTSG